MIPLDRRVSRQHRRNAGLSKSLSLLEVSFFFKVISLVSLSFTDSQVVVLIPKFFRQHSLFGFPRFQFCLPTPPD